MMRVAYVFPISHKFRVKFHELVREKLAHIGIDYTVVFSSPPEVNKKRQDTVDIPWGSKVPALRALREKFVLQLAFKDIFKSDVVVLQQENALILNYLAVVLGLLGRKKVAFFGHGRNIQAKDPNSMKETWKRFWSTRVTWWFAYTHQTKTYLESLGFDGQRITVLNNAVDTTAVQNWRSQVDIDAVRRIRNEHGLSSDNIAIFVGGLYPGKEIGFLIRAADIVQREMPDFQLLVVGGGPDAPTLMEAARTRPWVTAAGPVFDQAKVELMSVSRMLLIPGVVGLAVLDGGAAGLPILTRASPHHGPEIAYIQDGINGRILPAGGDEKAYAKAIIELFRNPARLAKMSKAAEAVAKTHTIEAMADNFVGGIELMLSSKPKE